MALTIRVMTTADFKPLADWMVTVPLWQRYGLTVERAITRFRAAQAQDDWLFTAEDEHPIGFAWVIPQGAFGRSAYLRLIGVHPNYTSGGVGAALLNMAETYARDALFLLVSDFNIDAQRFYERQGYIQIGAIPDYVVVGVTELIYWKRPGVPSTR
jgi:GNAT superfamily N-acetyltransferase